MKTHTLTGQEQPSEHEHEHIDTAGKVIFGFWVFILSDCVLFAILFSAYAVLYRNTFGGIGIKEVASLPYVLVQTLVLLVSNLTFGFSLAGFHKGSRALTMFWLAVTFVLGLIFIGMQGHEFAMLIQQGNSWQKSAFLSSFFTLIGVQGFHLIAGLAWILILFIQFMYKSTNEVMKVRMTCLGMFWHFLNIVWLFIFTIVFLMGAI